LKPGNVFFDDLTRQGLPKESKGYHFRIYVGDFGLADAFRDFGRNSGSRPYMAPEQFSKNPIDPTAPTSLDVFALGVIAFECFTDGYHPIDVDVTTADVFPWQPGVKQKWNRESTWRHWAEKADKSLPVMRPPLPSGIGDLITASLSPDPGARPSLEEFENRLWDTLRLLDSATHEGFRMQISYEEGLQSPNADWPFMEEELDKLRRFYSSL
jgi:serine/threonine protein kinase